MSALTERFDAICDRIAGAVARSGRPADAVRLVAVSKLHAAEIVAELAVHWSQRIGRPTFGESYMQEAREKMPRVRELLTLDRREAGRRDRAASGMLGRQEGGPALSRAEGDGCEPGLAPGEATSPIASVPTGRRDRAASGMEWHFIGHVQSKKARDIVGRFSLIHSVDSLKLAQALAKVWRDRVAGAPLGLDEAAPGPQNILIQVNVGREAQKSGVDPDALEPLLQGIAAMPELRPQGLMCIPPLADIGKDSRPYFVLLRELRDRTESVCGLCLPELSMGMSDDFEAAIEEGATLVRIGTDIFGVRAS